jgi:hypothetical protein
MFMNVKNKRCSNNISPPYVIFNLNPIKIIIMKKSVLLLLAACIFFNIANSQITKGNWMVGGNALFSSQSENLRGTAVKGLNIELLPGIGYFFIDKLAGGARISFKYSKTKYNGVSSNSTQVGLGPFLRYYFLNQEKRVNLFAETYYQYLLISGSNFKSYNENKLKFSAGPVIYFNSSVGMEFTVNYEIFNSNATNTDVKTLFFGIGFQIHLESNKN